MKHAAAVALGLVVVASSTRAQVSCSDPANLCTGDPCVITDVTVASPCTVDFGPRTVIIQGNLRVPAAGTLSFTAGAITLELNSRIDGTDLSGGGAGADVTLQASGEIDLKGRGIDTSGSPGGAITVEADGMLLAGALVAAKGLNGNGGHVILRGAAGVASARVEASAIRAGGGSIEVSSSAGPADVSGQLRAAGPDGGGTIAVIG